MLRYLRWGNCGKQVEVGVVRIEKKRQRPKAAFVANKAPILYP
jgi:hypothetical protein